MKTLIMTITFTVAEDGETNSIDDDASAMMMMMMMVMMMMTMFRWNLCTKGRWEREGFWDEFLQAPTCFLLMDLQGDDDHDNHYEMNKDNDHDNHNHE